MTGRGWLVTIALAALPAPTTPTAAAQETTAAQEATSAREAAPADLLRTPWGHPDLQGVWDYSTITPMQRPERYGDRAYLTEEEAAALEAGAEERDRTAAAAPARRAVAGENVGAYNLFWMDLGTEVVEDRRTSLIIDPTDGRYPAMTEAGAAAARSRRGFGADLPADEPPR